jgi:hypothetical protein
VLDHGEAVQPDEQNRLHMEEVGGQDPFRLALQELGPGRIAATGRRIKSGLLCNRPYGGGGDLAAEAGDLPSNAVPLENSAGAFDLEIRLPAVAVAETFTKYLSRWLTRPSGWFLLR